MYRPTLILAAFLLCQSSLVWADEATDMKQKELKACEKPEILKTGYRQIEAVEKCKCIVSKTDYAAVIAGNSTVKEQAEENKIACALRNAM